VERRRRRKGMEREEESGVGREIFSLTSQTLDISIS
jgi:hypothetical protein